MKRVQGRRERGVKMCSSLLVRTPERIELLLIKMGKHWEEVGFVCEEGMNCSILDTFKCPLGK